MKFIVIIGFITLILTTTNVMAKCANKTHITDIPYAKNSSYFSNKYSTRLDDIVTHYQSQSGYLLLEFKVNKVQRSEDVRHYNKWLASRRVERIRNYFNQASYSAPIISRILTASNETDRSVAVHWCDTQTDELHLRLAKISEAVPAAH
ncbi:hypothetical protein JK628_03920 [Shewanella sp. KX20019]|uniref:hypothetical protein n=1 Tax=Shewanella sp. KX20019 TaxID=2803864 RepID=UPI00192801C9|nr:hypothetical protein [Shewanella sp. KX20019]QQX81028.1 hypothetical protein JK628_03920 [Shewanella sp. KX20019]